MKKKFNLIYKLESDFQCSFFKNISIILFKTVDNCISIQLPSLYFFKLVEKKKNFLFLKRLFFFSIFKQFLLFYKNSIKIFYFKLRLRGLGYRIKKVTKKLYKFFFAFNHYYYYHVSNDVYVRHHKRNLIIFSNNLMKLNDIFSHLLLLKSLDLYERNNTFIVSKKILFLKKCK